VAAPGPRPRARREGQGRPAQAARGGRAPRGYTRIVRDWKNQVGDNAPRAIFELVDRVVEEPAGDDDAAAEKGKKGKAKGKAKQPTPSSKGKGKKAAAAEPAEAE
jgi:hypothetical protein